MSEARKGRLAIRSADALLGRDVEVLAVPDDGGEPIRIPVIECEVTAAAGEPIIGILSAYLAGCDVVGVTEDGEHQVRLTAEHERGGPAVYPDVTVTRDGEEVPYALSARWRLTAPTNGRTQLADVEAFERKAIAGEPANTNTTKEDER